MLEYKENLFRLKRLISNSETELLPLMKERTLYLKSLKESNPNVNEINKEFDLHEKLRSHLMLMMNYFSWMEDMNTQLMACIEKDESPEIKAIKDYVKVIEKELLYEFRKKHN